MGNRHVRAIRRNTFRTSMWTAATYGEAKRTRKIAQQHAATQEVLAVAQLAELQMSPLERAQRDSLRQHQVWWNGLSPAAQRAALEGTSRPPVTHRPPAEVAIEVLAWTWVVLVCIGRGLRAAWRWLARVIRWARHRLQHRV